MIGQDILRHDVILQDAIGLNQTYLDQTRQPKNGETGMAVTTRMNVSVPITLKRRMKMLGEEVNWSKVATAAFREKVEELEEWRRHLLGNRGQKRSKR